LPSLKPTFGRRSRRCPQQSQLPSAKAAPRGYPACLWLNRYGTTIRAIAETIGWLTTQSLKTLLL
jgi:hypothetical protein